MTTLGTNLARPRPQRTSFGINWSNLDIWLLLFVALLNIMGVAMIRSTTLDHPTLGALPGSQIQWMVVGVVIMFFMMVVDYRYWQSISQILYIAIVAFLAVGFFIGLVSAFGSARWYNLFGLSIQPSEMAKIGSLIWVANFFSRHRNKLDSLIWVGISGAYAGFPVFFILLQPDLSTSIVVMIVWFSMLFAAGLRWSHITMGGVAGAALLPIGWAAMLPYQRERVTDFLTSMTQSVLGIEPETLATYGSQYNVRQALISIGSGGWFGQGYSEATQIKYRFLKVRHTDFIYSATAAEFGFVGAMLVLLVLFLLVYRVLKVAEVAADPFGAYICYGFAGITFFQTIVNVGMNMNIMPVTGLPFPFLSYGGSSLVTFFVAVGMVQSVALRQNRRS